MVDVVVVTQAHIGNTQKRLVFDVVINCGRRCIGLSISWLFQVFCDDMVSFFSIGTYIFPIKSFIFLSLFFFLGWHGYISTFIWHNLCRPMLIGYCSMWRCILNLFVLNFAHKSLILAMATEWCYVLLEIWYSFANLVITYVYAGVFLPGGSVFLPGDSVFVDYEL